MLVQPAPDLPKFHVLTPSYGPHHLRIRPVLITVRLTVAEQYSKRPYHGLATG